MKIIIQKTRRKKTEHGFVFNEQPQVVAVCHNFPNIKKETGCAKKRLTGHYSKIHVATVPFGKYYSECDKKLNPCIPSNALTYKDGFYARKECCDKC